MAKRALTEDEQERYNEFYNEFLQKPLDYVRHDVDARLDEALRRAVTENGMQFYGSWWVLVELLSSKRGHIYDVTDETGWKLFAADMSTCGETWGVEDCKRFCSVLASHGLLDAELYERGKIVNNRVCREADGYATAAAGKKLGAFKVNAAKMLREGVDA